MAIDAFCGVYMGYKWVSRHWVCTGDMCLLGGLVVVCLFVVQ